MKTSAGLQTSGKVDEPTDDPRIEGPAEFDKYDDYTGHDYFRCTGCGVESIRLRDLGHGGCKCNGGWS